MGDTGAGYKAGSSYLLNAGLDEIYEITNGYIKPNERRELKGACAREFLVLERMFRSVYYADICKLYQFADRALFAKQFPFVYDNFANVEYSHGEAYGGRINSGLEFYLFLLSQLRNINIHAVLFEDLKKKFSVPVGFFDVFPALGGGVQYTKDGVITVAGMLIIMLSVMRKENCKSLLKALKRYLKDALNSGYKSDSWDTECEKLSEELQAVFKCDYDLPISSGEKGDGLLESMAGKLFSQLALEGEDSGVIKFSLDLCKQTDAPAYGIAGKLEKHCGGSTLTISAGSNIGRYYDSEYRLEIEDEELFLKLNSRVPSFMAIAYFAHNKIHKIDELTDVNFVNFDKLNQPKFYRDKDLLMLCSGNKNADMRTINDTVSGGLLQMVQRLEEEVYHSLKLKDGNYLRFSTVLKNVGVSGELFEKSVALRNFCAHYGIINNFAFSQSGKQYYCSLEFIIAVIEELIEFLMERHSEIADVVKKGLQIILFNGIVGVKYKRVVEASAALFWSASDDISTLIARIDKSLRTVQNSSVSIADENEICRKMADSFRFKLSRYSDKQEEFIFSRLTLIEIRGKLKFRGNALNGIKFFETPHTDWTEIKPQLEGQKIVWKGEDEQGAVIHKRFEVK